jgi:hypothetical protein
LIASIDGAGVVTLHYPANADAPALATALAQKPTSLPQAYVLDDAPQFERFFFITSEDPIEVAPTPPHHITRLGAQAIPRPPELAIARLGDAALAAAIRQRLERDAEAGRFAGAVHVAREGRTLFECAYGMADLDRFNVTGRTHRLITRLQWIY